MRAEQELLVSELTQRQAHVLEGIALYVGADAQNIQRRRLNLLGRRCFSGAYDKRIGWEAWRANGYRPEGLREIPA